MLEGPAQQALQGLGTLRLRLQPFTGLIPQLPAVCPATAVQQQALTIPCQ